MGFELMPIFTFNGFPVGSSVAISAAQGANSAANSVSAWGQGSMANVDILTTTHGVVSAPAPVRVEAIGLTGFDVVGGAGPGEVYDPSFHDITYIWSVRGSPLPAYPKPQNMHPSLNNPNVAYGKKAAFRFPLPGTYDIDLWCVDGTGNTATATTRVTVVAPSFAAADTIVFALDGNFAGAPAGTQVSTIGQLNAALAGRSNPTRVSFKPGETVPQARIRVNATENLRRVDTWTPGQKVTWHNRFIDFFTSSGIEFDFDVSNIMNELTVVDIRMDGGWDPTTETGEQGRGTFTFSRCRNPISVMIHDCEFRGQGFVDINLSDNPPTASALMIADCVVEDWQGYGIAAFPLSDTRGRYALLGNRVKQNPLALGGGPKTAMQNDHGCLRIANARELIVSCNDFFTTSGWSGWPPAANANCRLHSSVEPNSATVFERNVLEGGYLKIKIDGQNGGQTEYAGNHLIEKNVLIGTARTFAFFSGHYGGTTFRNNLCYMPDVPLFDGYMYDFYNVAPEAPDAGNNRAFSIYNNSFVSRESAGDRSLTIAAEDYWNTYTNENNVFYTPGNTGDGPLDFATALPGIAPRYVQTRFNFQIYATALGADVPNGGAVTIPYSALDQSTGFTHGTLNTGSTAATTQAYWQAAAAAGDNLHMMRVNTQDYGGQVLHAALGHFLVSYDASGVTITNTSGTAWYGGQWEVRLDRKSYLDSQLPPATVYASPGSVPTCAPLAAPGPGDTPGKLAYDDMLGAVRTQPVSPGAIEV